MKRSNHAEDYPFGHPRSLRTPTRPGQSRYTRCDGLRRGQNSKQPRQHMPTPFTTRRRQTALLLLAFLTLSTVAGPCGALARPPDFTGKDLARLGALYENAVREGRFPTEQEERQVNYFMGYVEGAALASRKICLPSTPGVRDQLSAATARYLREHRGEWRVAPDALVVKAVQPLFPCPKTLAPKR